MGFPTGERFTGSPEQKNKLEAQFLRKARFQHDRGTVAWNGEFGPVYADARTQTDAAEVNQERYNLLGAQLEVYDKYRVSWTIWLYKDIGVQGMVYTDPDGLWNRTIAPFLEKKKKYQLDAWGRHPSAQVDEVLDPLVRWIDSVCPTAKDTYPTPWDTKRHILRATLQTFVSQAFEVEFASLFKEFTLEELDEAAKSFRFDRCLQREGLNKIMSDHAKLRKSDKAEAPDVADRTRILESSSEPVLLP